MSTSTYSVFFSKEITCLPRLLDKYIGNYYNNAMANAMAWGFFVWLIVHYVFDRFVNAVLRQMKYPEYLRQRIKTTLWNFGFCAGSFMYCYATLSRDHIDVFNFHFKFLEQEIDFIPGQYVFGFLILSTYYAQSSFWEATQTGCIFSTLEQCCILLLATLTYFNGCVELLFLIVYINNLMQCILELSRTFSFQMYNKYFMDIITSVYFAFHVLASIFAYLVVMPLYVFIPVGRHIKTKLTMEYVLLNFVLWSWFVFSLYNSVICKLIKHYIWHVNQSEPICKKSYLQCSLFYPRSDTAFAVLQLRKEMETRATMMSIQRKKPNEAMFQTLKCMVSFRRKLKQRRESGPQCSENLIIAKSILEEIISQVVPDENIDNVENIENVRNVENIENVGNIENVDNIDNVEYIDNVENIEIVDNVKNVDNVENIENVDNVENIENFDNIENVEKLDTFEMAEKLDTVDNVEKLDTLDIVEKLETLDNAKKVDTVDNAETLDTVDNSEKLDTVDNIEKHDTVDNVEKDTVDNIEKLDTVDNVEKLDTIDKIDDELLIKLLPVEKDE